MQRILLPLARLLIHFGIGFPALAGLLKAAYVEAAMRHFALPGRPVSDSRVALLTGLHRKDVNQLRQATPAPSRASAPTLAAQVISRWIGHPDWQDAAGQPLALPRAGAAPSFETLVAGINRDLRPRTLLDELLRTGLVAETPQGLLAVARAADVPRGELERLAYYFGRNLADHLAAAGHNLMDEGPPFLERALAFDGLSEAAIAELSRIAEAEGMQLLTRLNARAMALAEADPPPPEQARRFLAGLYLFAADDPRPDAAPVAGVPDA